MNCSKVPDDDLRSLGGVTIHVTYDSEPRLKVRGRVEQSTPLITVCALCKTVERVLEDLNHG